MPFFELYEVDDGENIAMRRRSDREVDPRAGAPLDPAALELPVRFLMHAGEDGFYGQFDPDFDGDFTPRPVSARLRATYNAGTLMARALADALEAVGVDNLQCFPAEIRDAETDELLDHPYVFVNVIGRLDCATQVTSPPAGPGDSWDPDRLVIHPGETRGLHLFRLAASPSTLVVSERVAALADDPRFRGLRADPLETAERLAEG